MGSNADQNAQFNQEQRATNNTPNSNQGDDSKNYLRKRTKYANELLMHNLDRKHYPHQYSIQIRWGKPSNERKSYHTKDDETSNYRQYAHQEEEHWHDKKWINIGHPVDDDMKAPAGYAVRDKKFNTLPVYVRPTRNRADESNIRDHFAVPSKSFPVNQRFTEWAVSPVNVRSNRSNRNNYDNRHSSESRQRIYRRMPYQHQRIFTIWFCSRSFRDLHFVWVLFS